MEKLTDKQLLEAYYQAKELKLNNSFIRLIENEIYRRSIIIDKDKK
ncbi:sporulation histidine kinase inhibitor Sda [Virgibacillus doumboii]|nr:sporulation histidine kinase inhibitor Sda [Virgibacillus doumboii]